MKRTVIATALALAATLGPAWAQTTLAAERLAGHEVGGGNVVGGGRVATILGGGDDMAILYSTPGAGGGGAGWAQAGRSARFAATDGDDPQVEYTATAPARAGREAWLVGGGDEAQVVYSPRR
jgi:hypothetical protein